MLIRLKVCTNHLNLVYIKNVLLTVSRLTVSIHDLILVFYGKTHANDL